MKRSEKERGVARVKGEKSQIRKAAGADEMHAE
jgi:hypothetical protein